jgi:F0F1-type ATP synthase delta subunit
VAHDAAPARRTLALPTLASSPADIGRLIRELETIDETLLQLQLRHAGEQPRLPKTSYLLNKFAEHNQLNLLNAADRQYARRFLELVKQKAPQLHISFSADPSPAFMEKLLAWLRREIHPQVLVSTGLQPNIGAGCIVRTVNHHFDLSLKQNFVNSRSLLIEKIAAANAISQEAAKAAA